jgi:hypothetical protein
MENIAPLYKILCLCLIFLVPLAPAYLLYRITPDDKFLATGNFTGFKINATGASAIFIVLFAALYPKVNFIIDSIDAVTSMQHKITSLQKSRPWKVEYSLKLMTDSSHEINDMEYENVIKPDSILCSPRTIRFDPDTKLLTFYIDDDVFEKMDGRIKGCLVLRNGFGTANFLTSPADEQLNSKLIRLSSVYYKQSSKSYPEPSINSNAQILDKKSSLSKPPLNN